MFELFNPSNRSRLLAGLAVAGLALAATPSFAQEIEELTVTGRIGPSGEVEELSRVVSYGDLDLTLASDRAVLKDRVSDTAHELCEQLGESRAPVPPVTTSCHRKAVNDAMPQVRRAYAEAQPRTSTSLAYAEPAYEPLPPAPAPEAYDATRYSAPVSATEHQVITNGPVPDTPTNRSRYGGPMSNAGRNTTPAGN
jgi:UrcA family protein